MDNAISKYLDVCLYELNSEHQFYFDAVDLIDILKGVHLFYESARGNEFQKQYFEHENRVVQALAFGGFLAKKIALLPPHQVELYDNIKRGLEPTTTLNYLDLFWKNIGYYNKLENLSNDYNDKTTDEEIKTWLQDKGKDFFKAIFFSYKLTWQERLVELIDNEIITLNDYEIGDIEIYDQELFYRLLDAFANTKKRATKSENNYRDVLSLMYLARKVKQYNDGKIEFIPIYFDSQNFLSIVPEDIIKDFFTIKLKRNKLTSKENIYTSKENSCALRSYSYFMLYSLLSLNKKFPYDEDKRYENFAQKKHEIIEIKRSLDDIQYTENIVGSRKHLEYEKKALEEKIDKYISYDFFYTILLQFISEDRTIIKKVFSDIKIPVLKEEIIEKLKESVQNILNKLDNEISKITNWSATYFNEIDKRVDLLREIISNRFEKKKDFDVFNHYSLFRFFIPERYQKDIVRLFSSDGLLSDDFKIYRGSTVMIWNLVFRSLNNSSNNKLTESELFKLFCSFWILSIYDKVAEIKINDDEIHHSLLMLKGACVDRAVNESKRQFKFAKVTEKLRLTYDNVIEVLNKRIDASNDKAIDYGEISIALSYLYFHLWLQNDNELFFDKISINSVVHKNNTKDNGNLIAIAHAKQALDFFNKYSYKENKHRIYALNLYIYYIIASCDNENFEKISFLINEFISLKPMSDDWNFRYDSTIARNFHRRSLLAKDKFNKISFANTALKVLDEALTKLEGLNGRDLKEIESYKLRLLNYIGELDT